MTPYPHTRRECMVCALQLIAPSQLVPLDRQTASQPASQPYRQTLVFVVDTLFLYSLPFCTPSLLTIALYSNTILTLLLP